MPSSSQSRAIEDSRVLVGSLETTTAREAIDHFPW